MIYYTVADKNYPTMMALKTKVNECFTEALSGFIISDSRMYREFDGEAVRGSQRQTSGPPGKGPPPSTSCGNPPPGSTWKYPLP